MQDGALYPLPMSEQITSDNAYGSLLPTPMAIDGLMNHTPKAEIYTDTTGKPRKRLESGRSASLGLGRMAYLNMWPTPRAVEGEKANQTYGGGNLTLTGAVKRWPTPKARDHRKQGGPSEQARNTPDLPTQVGGKLNPMWVEWLMGWPIGWTDLKPLEMAKFQQWLQKHGAF
jgi:hypothetical protein